MCSKTHFQRILIAFPHFSLSAANVFELNSGLEITSMYTWSFQN